MIYFPVYANMKKNYFGEGKQGKVLSLGELLAAAGIGGIPAVSTLLSFATEPSPSMLGNFSKFIKTLSKYLIRNWNFAKVVLSSDSLHRQFSLETQRVPC
jgi:hypothetical protein